MARILVAEDNLKQAELLRSYLQADGHDIAMAHDGLSAIEQLRTRRPDLALLDVMLPHLSGFDVCRLARTEQLPTALIMVTARASEDDQIGGLELGADDYVVKPYSMRHLMARVRAVLRRADSFTSAPEPLQLGGVRLDRERCEVWVEEQQIELTAREYAVLEALAVRPGRVLSRRQLLEEIAGFDTQSLERTVDMHVLNLRRKIEQDPSQPELVVTVKGRGYKLQVPQ